MLRESVTIRMPGGLETRPLAMLVQIAGRYQSAIQLENGPKCVNAKSIMGMMTLGLDNGESVTVCADGPDEQEAVSSIREYLSQEKI